MNEDFLTAVRRLKDEAPDAEVQGVNSTLAAIASAAATLFASASAKADLSYDLSRIYHEGRMSLLKLQMEQQEENARLFGSGSPGPASMMYVPSPGDAQKLLNLASQFGGGAHITPAPSPFPTPQSGPAAMTRQQWATLFVSLYNAAVADMGGLGDMYDITCWFSTPEGFRVIAADYERFSQSAMEGLLSSSLEEQRSAIALSAILCNIAGYSNAQPVFQHIVATLESRRSRVLHIGNIGALFM